MKSSDDPGRGTRRRTFLAGGTSALALGLSGCSGVLSGDDRPADSSGSEDESSDQESFTLPVEGDAETIEYGQTKTATIDGDAPESETYYGRYHPWTFVADRGDVVTVDVSAGAESTVLFLLDGDGETVARNPDSTGSDIPLSGVSIPEGGTYVVVVAVGLSAVAPVEYQLSVEEGVDEPADDLRSIAIGETKRGEIDVADPLGGKDDINYEPVRFEGEAGESVTIEMVADGMLPAPVLYGPEGELISEIDGSGDFSTGRIPNVELAQSGTYTIRSRLLGGVGRHEYELTVESA